MDIFYYDVIDMNNGEKIGQISDAESGLPFNGRLTTMDRNQTMYIERESPEVEIFKYSFLGE